jgi:hypothetical protein
MILLQHETSRFEYMHDLYWKLETGNWREL